LAGAEPILPDGWAIAVEETAAGALLSAKTVEVFYEEQQWQFYYVGFDARDS
jgi:hypothetical protein